MNNFGKIVTNGINYWICLTSYEATCQCGNKLETVEKYSPVLIDKDGLPYTIQGFRDTTLEKIKPFAKPYNPPKQS